MHYFISYMLFDVPEHSIPPKQLSIADFTIVAKEPFLIQYCDVTTVDLWHHANVGH